MDSVLSGTPLSELHSSGALNRSRYPVAHYSDALRAAILFKVE